jgi:hypothetical protein
MMAYPENQYLSTGSPPTAEKPLLFGTRESTFVA